MYGKWNRNFTIKSIFLSLPTKDCPHLCYRELLYQNWKCGLCSKVNNKGRVENNQFKTIMTWPRYNRCSCRSERILLMRKKNIRGKYINGLKLYQPEHFLNNISKKNTFSWTLEVLSLLLSLSPQGHWNQESCINVHQQIWSWGCVSVKIGMDGYNNCWNLYLYLLFMASKMNL